MKVKVYDPSGEQFAEVSDYAAGALLMSLYGEGSTIRLKNVILWLEGADGNAAESYDNTSFIIAERLRKVGAIQ